jgi:hypothetical protein
MKVSDVMSKNDVLYWIVEFVSEHGQWHSLIDYLKEKGLSSKDIVKALNENAKEAGYSADLTEEDCE